MKTEILEILECECRSIDHSYIIRGDEYDDGEKVVYIEPHLSTGGIFHRLKYAIKYIFGWKCRYGCFDEIIITEKNYEPLKKIIDFLEKS